jgi:hypothetical protein
MLDIDSNSNNHCFNLKLEVKKAQKIESIVKLTIFIHIKFYYKFINIIMAFSVTELSYYFIL